MLIGVHLLFKEGTGHDRETDFTSNKITKFSLRDVDDFESES